MVDALAIGGSVASVLAAGLAFWQAGRARKHANRAKRVHTAMVAQRQIGELVILQDQTKRILNQVVRVGPTCTKDGIRGIRAADIARNVEEFSLQVIQCADHFDRETPNQARELVADVEPMIARLAAATDYDSIKEAGTGLYHRLKQFMPVIKRMSEAKSDKTIAT